MNNGYIEIMMPEHPNARSNGTVLEHRLVAERKLGRYLKRTEVVHHIDENKTHNVEENLIIFRTNSDHSRFHKIGIMKDMGDGTYICPVPANEISQCKCCEKYFIKSKDKRDNKYCSVECYKNFCVKQFESREDRPNKELLQKLVKDCPFTEIGKIYGVSDNAVRKWCKKYDIPYKYRDNHPKNEIIRDKRFVLDEYEVKMIDSCNEVIYPNIHDAVNFVKMNYAKNSTTERNIRTKIADAAKHNTKYFGFNWVLLPKVS